MAIKKVLFVCMGNICRSPTAEAVFTRLVKDKGAEQEFMIDSAGTLSYHAGSKPDHRSRQAGKKRGLLMDHMRARQVTTEDYEKFDWLVVMDEDNRRNLQRMFPNIPQQKVFSMMSFAPTTGYSEVPDPYYGAGDGFELVLDLLETACEGFYDFLCQQSSTSL
ncbi:MAG: low molecular weight phosphotyrosine protein phosphatase [Xanthomonadales bacterium]|nr:low molecular weight phosphotyrosine protein phosphatase [Xanthomonadales bacterium]